MKILCCRLFVGRKEQTERRVGGEKSGVSCASNSKIHGGIQTISHEQDIDAAIPASCSHSLELEQDTFHMRRMWFILKPKHVYDTSVGLQIGPLIRSRLKLTHI